MAVKIWLTGVAACAFALPSLGHATLGEPLGSVRNDSARMRAAGVPALARSGYTVHEYQTPSGATVREFAAADGTVFAVAWQGPTLPDITHLLGKYFDQYKGAMDARGGTTGSRRRASLRQDDLVVQSYGHVGAFYGKAYLPQLLPQGVSPDQLQ